MSDIDQRRRPLLRYKRIRRKYVLGWTVLKAIEFLFCALVVALGLALVAVFMQLIFSFPYLLAFICLITAYRYVRHLAYWQRRLWSKGDVNAEKSVRRMERWDELNQRICSLSARFWW